MFTVRVRLFPGKCSRIGMLHLGRLRDGLTTSHRYPPEKPVSTYQKGTFPGWNPTKISQFKNKPHTIVHFDDSPSFCYIKLVNQALKLLFLVPNVKVMILNQK